jgi:hypothetical protein
MGDWNTLTAASTMPKRSAAGTLPKTFYSPHFRPLKWQGAPVEVWVRSNRDGRTCGAKGRCSLTIAEVRSVGRLVGRFGLPRPTN